MVPMDWDDEDDETDATFEPVHLHDAAIVSNLIYHGWEYTIPYSIFHNDPFA